MRTALSFSNSKRGSILLEIAAAIAVLGVLSGALIRKNLVMNKSMKIQVTKNNINTVAISLAAFVAQNKRLPRPAADFNGVESSSHIISGYIPYKTLGISDKTAKDGFLKPLTYIVEPALADSNSRIFDEMFPEDCFCKSIISPTISMHDVNPSDIIAFAIDTENHKHSITASSARLKPTEYTFFLTRDMLLMKYLQIAPCSRENVISSQHSEF